MQERWLVLGWRLAPGAGDKALLLWTMLEALYNWPPRAYHNLAHVQAVLVVFDHVVHEAQRPDEVEFALFLHDCVYTPGRADNEAQSAAIAQMFLLEMACDQQLAHRVNALIMATAHDQSHLTGDAELISDIDMAILGAPPDEYDRYASSIADEFAFAGLQRYRDGRRAFLSDLLARQRIFRREALHARFEASARANLARELAHL